MAALAQLNPAFAIVECMERRLGDLENPNCDKRTILENLSKLYYYACELEPHCHWWEIKRCYNILMRGFKQLTDGSRIVDRLQLAKYEMQGSKGDLICIYRKFIREMKRFDLKLATELMR